MSRDIIENMRVDVFRNYDRDSYTVRLIDTTTMEIYEYIYNDIPFTTYPHWETPIIVRFWVRHAKERLAREWGSIYE